MIERKTVLDTVELHRDGSVGIRLGLLLIEDGVEIDCKWHRTLIDGGVTPEQQMEAVNQHLTEMGKPILPAEEIAFIREMKQVHDRTLPSRPKFAKPEKANEGL